MAAMARSPDRRSAVSVSVMSLPSGVALSDRTPVPRKYWQGVTALLGLALLLAGCGGDDSASGPTSASAPSTTSTPTTTTTPSVRLHLRLTTTDGLVAQNADDVRCDWGDVRYEISDRNADEVIDVGDINPAGVVGGLMPNYECNLETSIELPAVDFYELHLTGAPLIGEQWEFADTFDRSEVETGITVTVGPS